MPRLDCDCTIVSVRILLYQRTVGCKIRNITDDCERLRRVWEYQDRLFHNRYLRLGWHPRARQSCASLHTSSEEQITVKSCPYFDASSWRGQPLSHIHRTSWHRPIENKLDFVGVGANAFVTNKASQYQDPGCSEDALACVSIELVCHHANKHLSTVLSVNYRSRLFILYLVVHEDVVQVCLHKLSHRAEDLHDEMIERRFVLERPCGIIKRS